MAFTSPDSLQLRKHVSWSNKFIDFTFDIYAFFLLDEKNVYPLFESLDRVENMLEGKKYLVQDTFTEADIRLFTTIVRYTDIS